MTDLLQKFQEEECMVCVHTNISDPGKFIYGQIIGLDEIYFAVSTISPDGEYDGVLIKLIEDIVYIEQSLSYDRRMVALMKSRGYSERKTEANALDLLQWGLSYAKGKNAIISLELCHSGVDDVVGFVDEISDNTFSMFPLNEEGAVDGKSYVMKRDVSQLCCESRDENRLQILFNNAVCK